MKKIYAGSELAVVVLDTPEEIEAVTLALKDRLEMIELTGARSEATERLLAEINAPAP